MVKFCSIKNRKTIRAFRQKRMRDLVEFIGYYCQFIFIIRKYIRLHEYQSTPMTSNKIYNYKATITIHQIHITVKFPCSVSIALKNKNFDPKSSPPTSEFRLEQGCAKANHQITTDISLKHNPKLGLFTQEKINFIIYLKSSSGKIPAGSSTVVVKSDKEQNRVSVGIDKCPDRNARIEYSLSLKFINQEQCLNESIVSRSTIQYPVVHSIPQNRTPRAQNRDYYQAPRKTPLKSELYSSRVSSQAQNRNFFPDDRSQKSETGSNSRISRIIMRQHEMQASTQRQKIIQLERQKSKAMKQIRSLKHQLQTASLKNSNVSERQDHYLAEKRQSRIMMLQDQVDKEKNKTSEFRTQLHKVKLRAQQADKDLKINQRKCRELEEQIKIHTEQKEQLKNKNKQISNQLRQLKQKYEDALLLHENAIKRSEFKENVYKQQIKALNEKYAVSQAEKQKLLFQKNQILNDMERKQFKDKQVVRDRQKQFLEEKNKSTKRIDALERQLNALKQQKQANDQVKVQMQLEQHKMKLQYEQSKNTIEQLQKELAEIQLQLTRQKTNKKQLQNRNNLDNRNRDQIRKLKSTIQEQQAQITEKNKVIHQLEVSKKLATNKIQQYERSTRDKQNTIFQLQREVELVNNKLKNLKSERISFGEQDITFMNEQSNLPYFPNTHEAPKSQVGTMNRPTMKPKIINNKNSQGEAQLQKKIQELNRKLEQSKEENHDLCEQNFLVANNLMNAEQNCKELQKKYQEMITKSEELTFALEEVDSLRSQNLQLSKQIDSVLAIKTEIQETYEQQLKQKIIKIKDLETEIDNLRQNKDDRNQMDQLEESHKFITQKEEELKQLNIQLMHAQDHIKILQETAQYQTMQQAKLQAQIQRLKARTHEKSQRNMRSQRNMVIEDTQSKHYEGLLKASNQQIVKYEQQLNKKQQELSEMDDKLVSLQGELDRYWQEFNENKQKFQQKTMDLLICESKIREQQQQIDQLIKENQQFRKAIEENEAGKEAEVEIEIELQSFRREINRVLPPKYRLPETQNIHPNAIILQIQEMVLDREERQKKLIDLVNSSETQAQNSIFKQQQNNVLKLDIIEKEKEIQRLVNQLDKKQQQVTKLSEKNKELQWMNKKIGDEEMDENNMLKVMKLENEDLVLKLTNLQNRNAVLQKQAKMRNQKNQQRKGSEAIAQQLLNVIKQLPTQRRDREKVINCLGQYKEVLRKLLDYQQPQKQHTESKQMEKRVKELNKGLQRFKLNIMTTLNRMPQAKTNPQLKNIMNQFRELQMAVDRLSSKG